MLDFLRSLLNPNPDWQALLIIAIAVFLFIYGLSQVTWRRSPAQQQAPQHAKTRKEELEDELKKKQDDFEHNLAALKGKEWRDRAREYLTMYRAHLIERIELLKKIMHEEEADDSSFSPPPHAQEWYWAVVAAYLTGQVVIALLVWRFGGLSTVSYLGGVVPINIGLFVYFAQALHFFDSLRNVRVDELGGIDIFGRPLYTPKTGLYVVPRFLLTLTRASRNYHDVRYPGHPDRIFRISEDKQKTRDLGDAPELGSGMVRPIFVTTGEPFLNEEEAKKRKENPESFNPLDEQLNVEIAYFIRYRPHQDYGGIFRLIRNIGGVRGRGPDQVRDVMENLLQEQSERDIKSIITKQTAATVFENWSLVNDVFTYLLQESVLRLGIDVDRRGGLDDLNVSRETNTRQAAVSRAEFSRRETVISAEAEARKTYLNLEAIARGYEEIKKKTGVDGEAVIAAETLKGTLSDKADTIVVGAPGVADLFGMLKAGQGVLQRNKRHGEPPAHADGTPPTPTSPTAPAAGAP